MKKSTLRRHRMMLVGITLLLVIAAFTVRTLVYEREAATVRRIIGADFVPFDRESAIMYDYAQRVADGRGIPRYDTGLGGMEKVPVASQMLVGMEYFLGWGYQLKQALFGMPEYTDKDRVYEDNPDFAKWARIQIRFWISLVAGMIFLWLAILRVPYWIGTAAALVYVFSPAAIARYTGQDLVRGEFCMPFIVLTLVLAAAILRRPATYKYFWLAVAAFGAFAFWDGTQALVTVWAGFEIVRTVWSGHASRKRTTLWLVIFCAEVLAAILVPYQRYHGLITAPLTLVVLPALLTVLSLANRVDGHYFGRRAVLLLQQRPRWRRLAAVKVAGLAVSCCGRLLRQLAAALDRLPRWRKRLTLAATVLVLLGIVWALLPGYSHNYNHFGRLLLAKLMFFNIKPTDPTQLNFDARILWTPAMHSASLALTRVFYPVALWLALVLTALPLAWRAGRSRLRHDLPRLFLPLALTVFFFLFYILIVRAHVFCAVFLGVLFGLALDNFRRSLPAPRFRLLRLPLTALLALLALWGEAATARGVQRSYPPGTLREISTLIKWLRSARAQGITVLTDMTLSPVLKGYCGVRIITQPKFELKKTRDLVEEQINLMYWGNEESLGDFCRKYGVDLVIFDRGNSYDAPMPIYSTRYMAAARDVRRDAPAWFMAKRPERLHTFYLVPLPYLKLAMKRNFPYYMFRYVAPEERLKADKAADLAESFRRTERPITARKMSAMAYASAPNSEKAYLAYYQAWGVPPEDIISLLSRVRRGEIEQLAAEHKTPKKRRIIINGIDYSNEK